MGVLEDIDEYSSLDQLRGLYGAYGDYEYKQSMERAAIFQKAANFLLVRMATMANLGTESASFAVSEISKRLDRVDRWLNANNRETAGTVLNFNDFDVM